MSLEIATEAAALWGWKGASLALAAARENQVFCLTLPDRRLALRLHRPGYRSDTELTSELQWMSALREAGLAVPCPIRAKDGSFLQISHGYQVDVLTWLEGAPLGYTGQPLVRTDSKDLFFALGQTLADLHKASDEWQRPPDFQRCAWDQAGLLGEAPVWDRFWDNEALSPLDRDLFLRFRETAALTLSTANLDFGLIHADPVRENVLIDQGRAQLIDFDDGGFGYRLFDLATALIKNRNEPNYETLKGAVLEGYLSRRFLSLDHLPLMLALRATTYLGWIRTRVTEPGGRERQNRFIVQARDLVSAWLES